MNYRHAFHAGNFADVFKHALLARMLVYLTKKPQPLRFIDTHAGIGRYDLSASEASRTGEWKDGIGRIRAATPPPEVADLLAPWLQAIGAADEDGCPLSYPGSPALACAILRPHDRIALNERHPEDCRTLRANLGKDARVRIADMDGYAALNAWIPPVERRGLVLIDPPFEERDEFETLAKALLRAWKKWKTGTYCVWYPIKDVPALNTFRRTMSEGGLLPRLELELRIAHASPGGPLSATGMSIVNPPYTLHEEARILLPWLSAKLGRDTGSGWSADLVEC